MGHEYFVSSEPRNRRPRSVSPPKEPTSNSPTDQRTVRYFLLGIYISQLKRLISVMEAEIVKDERTILECREAIVQRREKISGYKEKINDIKQQMDYYK